MWWVVAQVKTTREPWSLPRSGPWLLVCALGKPATRVTERGQPLVNVKTLRQGVPRTGRCARLRASGRGGHGGRPPRLKRAAAGAARPPQPPGKAQGEAWELFRTSQSHTSAEAEGRAPGRGEDSREEGGAWTKQARAAARPSAPARAGLAAAPHRSPSRPPGRAARCPI